MLVTNITETKEKNNFKCNTTNPINLEGPPYFAKTDL